jgi:hypothetical protein
LGKDREWVDIYFLKCIVYDFLWEDGKYDKDDFVEIQTLGESIVEYLKR